MQPDLLKRALQCVRYGTALVEGFGPDPQAAVRWMTLDREAARP